MPQPGADGDRDQQFEADDADGVRDFAVVERDEQAGHGGGVFVEDEEGQPVHGAQRQGERGQHDVPGAQCLVAGASADPAGGGQHAPAERQAHGQVGQAAGERRGVTDAVVVW